jgi:transcriptional regulator with XRE-family HTH domain
MSARLRAIREGAGMTQERLAAQAGLSVATVRKIETGLVVEPGYFTVMAMLSVLGASPQDLQGETGNRHK